MNPSFQGSQTMHSETLDQPGARESASAKSPRNVAQVIVCIDDVATAEKTAPHAIAVAHALGSEVTLINVIEPSGDPHAPADPVEWDIRRREAQLLVERLAERNAFLNTTVSTRVLEGSCAEQVGSCIRNAEQDITVFCRRDDKQPWHIGSTARKILESGEGSVLIVPSEVSGETPVRYDRLLVPLDGSARAENAIPVAAQIALEHEAELVLVHDTADFSLVETGPLESFDIELQAQVNQRNERVSKSYLEKVRQRLEFSGINAATLVLKGPDARRLLTELSDTQSSDLVVFTSHGCSGHQDVPMGDVAGFILTRSPIPALMVRKGGQGAYAHMFSDPGCSVLRMPEGSQL